MAIFDKNAKAPIYELLNGDYPFEIIGVDKSFSKGSKTNMSDVFEVKLKFFSDTTFTKPVAQFVERLIDHPSCDWKMSTLALSTGFPMDDRQDFKITEEWIGYRGWATCKPETDKNDPTKKYNRVAVFITNKGHLPRVSAPAPVADDDIPF